MENELNFSKAANRFAHDISSPILAMEMTINMFEKKYAKEDLNILRKAINQIREISMKLIGDCQDEALMRTTDIKNLLADIVKLKRLEWNEKSFKLYVLDSNLKNSDTVLGEKCEISRLISNLLNNALESCSDNAKIHIIASSHNKIVRIDIKDNGCGISPNNIWPCLHGKSLKHDGRGLGLSNSREYMKILGGKLILTSTLGKGTTVKLLFRSP